MGNGGMTKTIKDRSDVHFIKTYFSVPQHFALHTVSSHRRVVLTYFTSTPHSASQLRTHTCPRNALNLDRHALGQLLDRDAAACRLVRKVLFEDAVHLGEVGHVVEEDIDLYRGSALLFRLMLRFCADAKLVVVQGVECTLTTLSILTPASVNIPTMFSQHCFVLSAMLPSIKLPLVSAGIWPET
tara:strand:+ start:348 stop:902 length:555 start_codon:yes stop_codon:yes gene_type:complete